LLIVLYRCETLSLALREEDRLRVFENRVLRSLIGPKRDEIRGGCKNCIVRSPIMCTFHQILLG
jgi:hypothetical protein